MGYRGVMTLVDHLEGKSVQKRIETAVTLVTRQNMEEPAIQNLLQPPLDTYLR
jgi:ribose transport system substrate-binding protein